MSINHQLTVNGYIMKQGFALDDGFLELGFLVSRHRAAATIHLFLESLHQRSGYGLAIDDSNVLSHRGQCSRTQQSSCNQAGQELFFHAKSKLFYQ